MSPRFCAKSTSKKKYEDRLQIQPSRHKWPVIYFTLCGSLALIVMQGILWSRQPDFGVNPCSNVDASILVTGTRAGALIFLRYLIHTGLVSSERLERFDTFTSTPRVLGAVSVAEIWVTHLAISPWTITESGKSCKSFILAQPSLDVA